MFNKIDYSMIMVSDMDRSIKFYRDTLGFKLRFQSKDWTEFDTDGTTLALHGGGKPNPQGAQSHEEKRAGTVSIGLSVKNLDESVKTLKKKGVRFTMEPTVREGEGIKLAIFVDPDGMPISLAETVSHHG